MNDKRSIIAPAPSDHSDINYPEPLEAGSYMARCVGMYDLGTQKSIFQGEEKFARKILLSFEFPTELHKFKEENGEEPRVLSRQFTLSMHKMSTLRPFLENWRGKKFSDQEAEKFDVTTLLGVECLLSLTADEKGDKTYNNIQSASKLPKGMTCPEQITDSKVFTFDPWDEKLFESLPNWIMEKIKLSPEYKAATSEPATDDIPF